MANGYTKINNVMFDDLAKLDISAHEMRVLLFIIRNTICYHQQCRDISLSYIAAGTGISVRQVKRVLKKLSEHNLIKITQESKGCHPQKIKLLGDISGQSWGHFRSSLGDMGDPNSGDMGDPQEIEINKNIINKKEEKDFSLSQSQEMSDEEWDKQWED